MNDYTKPPYADEDGNPTIKNPNYHSWKIKQDMKNQRYVNGAWKGHASITLDPSRATGRRMQGPSHFAPSYYRRQLRAATSDTDLNTLTLLSILSQP